MNAKASNILSSNDLSFKRDNKFFDIKKNINKDMDFKEKVNLFTKEQKRENPYQVTVKDKDQRELGKTSKDNKLKGKKDVKEDQEKIESKKPSKSQGPEENIQKEDPVSEDQKIQAYLLSLFKSSSNSNEKIDLEKLLDSSETIDINIDLEEANLNPIGQADNMEVSYDLKEISSQLINLQNKNMQNSENLKVEVEDEDENLVKAVNIEATSSKEYKQDTVAEEKTTKKDESSIFNLESLEDISEKENPKNSKSEKLDSSQNSKIKEESPKIKEEPEKLNLEAEDLEIDKAKIDTKDKAFPMDKRSELNIEKNLDQAISKAEPVDMKKNIQEIAEKMKFTMNNAKNQIKINLKPETLGELTMEIEVVKSVLTARIMVDNEKAKQLIQDNLFQLKDEIKNTGLEIKTFEVFVDNGDDFSKQGRGQFTFNQFNKKNKNNGDIRKKNMDGEYLETSIIKDVAGNYMEGSLNLLA